MSHHPPPFPIILLSLIFSLLPQLPALPNPDPAAIQSFHPTPTPPLTIPSFPEQSAISGCPAHLPDQLFPAVKSSCTTQHSGQQLSRSKCCPVLAAWLYSAYSYTALGTGRGTGSSRVEQTASYEMPLLPDDSETCVDGLEKMMSDRGVNLVRPNATCDVVYCFCGIRLHPLSCPQAFRVSEDGILVEDQRVKRLEKDCLSAKNGTKSAGYTSLARCSKCLNSLYKLKKGGNATTAERRTSQMRSRDCDLMGLTWLLYKDRDAYMSTVTAVMRALMLNADDSDPQSCSLSSDGMPLAVDSVEINDQSSSSAPQFSGYLYLLTLFLLIMSPGVLSNYF